MPIGSATILSITTNATLAVFGAALALLVAWHDPRRRGNRYFGLSMLAFALYGTVNTAWQVPQQFDLEPEPLLNLTTTLFITGFILLCNFMIDFGDLPRRVQVLVNAVSLPLGVLITVLLWGGHIYTDFEPQSTGNYLFTLTPLGYICALVALVYLLGSVGLLYAYRSPKAHNLSLPVAVLALGIVAFSNAPGLRAYSLNAIGATTALVMIGRLVIKYQVFQPLADLNAELSAKNEQLLEATLMKSRFLANMSHELRTPLNSIIGYTELVTNRTYGELTDPQVDRLQKVMRSGRLLLELINDVLDLSKIEAGRLNLTLVRVPTADLLDGLLSDFEPQAAEKGLKLVRGYSGLPALWVDEVRARQILSNLLSNAIKFTERGAVIVRGHFAVEQREVILSVTDTGPGIAPADQERVFEAFSQAGDPLTRQHEGTGLGLTIARHLTQMHGGRIWFESTLGQGTTFHVALPAAKDIKITPSLASRIIEPGPRAKGPLVLVIDDDCETIEMVQDHLETASFRVYGACNPNDGLRLAYERHPALIIVDIRMPTIDGWQVIEALRRAPDTASTPILVITATDDFTPAQLTSADDLLAKPVQPQELLAAVHRLLAATQDDQEVTS
ncbi:MAG: response regulator [Anaerolineae bacterium]|nr:response regulator [Anaerolineae bacterium]